MRNNIKTTVKRHAMIGGFKGQRIGSKVEIYCDISGSHGGDYGGDSRLGYYVV
jgi:hypothetical protein